MMVQEPSLRGDTRRIKNELKDLIVDARQQGMQAIEYMKSVINASFTDEKGNFKLRLEIPPNEIEFFIICATLVPLGFWSTLLAFILGLLVSLISML